MDVRNITNCGICKDRSRCMVGQGIPEVITPDPTFDSMLSDPYFLPSGLYEPPQVEVDDIKLDMSSYFSLDMRTFIFNTVLNYRADPYEDTSDQSSETFPIYDVDIPIIKEYMDDLSFSSPFDLKGLDFFRKVSKLDLTLSGIEVLDLRGLERLKILNVVGPDIKVIYLPNVASRVDDYMNELTYGITLDTPNLEYLDNRTMQETRAGWVNIGDFKDYSYLRYLYVPSEANNQDFSQIEMEDIENHPLINYLRIGVKPYKEETGSSSVWKLNLANVNGFINLPLEDWLDNPYFNSTCSGTLNESAGIITWYSSSIEESGFKLNQYVSCIIIK